MVAVGMSLYVLALTEPVYEQSEFEKILAIFTYWMLAISGCYLTWQKMPWLVLNTALAGCVLWFVSMKTRATA